MASRGRKGFVTLAFALAACAAFEGPQPSASEHTICYTRLATSVARLDALAKEACNGGRATFVRQELDLSGCPLLVPERAYFTCTA